MAPGQLRAAVHLQELVPVLSLIHQGLHRSVGIPTPDRPGISQVPQDYLPSVTSLFERVEDVEIYCM